jgi:hypothetical protein
VSPFLGAISRLRCAALAAVSARGRSGPHFRLVSAGPGFDAGYSSGIREGI